MSTIAVGSVAAFYFLAYLPHFIKRHYSDKIKAYDNSDPRSTVERMQAQKVDPKTISIVKRFEAAHNNALENFGPYAAAIILALIRHAPIQSVNNAAMAFIALRSLYLVAVAANKASLRTLIWTGSAGCISYLYYLAVKA
eukprot:TRINITY_DN1721_c0_g1_i1.p1 TRINITY_DN1721_c0_g1~~TRINITY_DN1721_c0_g1_i1.p1  ORF type:complete len:140 (-),score=10.09 TRINITY_DN1721_c0_g1_i1:113-532(-)